MKNIKYEIPGPEKEDILDDSIVKNALNIIDKLLNTKLNLDITTQSEVAELLDYPERFIKDKKIIEDIKDLKGLIIEMSDIYYA